MKWTMFSLGFSVAMLIATVSIVAKDWHKRPGPTTDAVELWHPINGKWHQLVQKYDPGGAVQYLTNGKKECPSCLSTRK